MQNVYDLFKDEGKITAEPSHLRAYFRFVLRDLRVIIKHHLRLVHWFLEEGGL